MTFKWLFWHLWAAGSWYFLPAAMSQISMCCDRVCVQACVCLFAVSECALSRVWMCSLCLKLGCDVCKGACSNYGQLCSLYAHSHQPDITTTLQTHHTFRCMCKSLHVITTMLQQSSHPNISIFLLILAETPRFSFSSSVSLASVLLWISDSHCRHCLTCWSSIFSPNPSFYFLSFPFFRSRMGSARPRLQTWRSAASWSARD